MPEKILVKARLKIEDEEVDYRSLNSLRQETNPSEKVETVLKTLEVLDAYWNARRQLLKGLYQHLRPHVFDHYVKPRLTLVTCCSEGVIVLYQEREVHGTAGGWSEQPLQDLVRMLSGKYVHILEEGEKPQGVLTGPKVTMSTVGPKGEEREFASFHPIWVVGIKKTAKLPATFPPVQLLGTTSTCDISLVGEIVPVEPRGAREPSKPFVTRTPLRLPVSWEALDVYGPFPPEGQSSARIKQWAENNILLVAARENAHLEKFRSLDPKFEAREFFGKLVAEFDHVLAEAGREEDLQRFLRDNPVFVDPTHSRVWPKLALGQRVTDFVFRSATGQYLLVELERPNKPLFTRGGVQSAELTQALDQITDWRRYIEDNLDTVQRELGLTDITPQAQALVVIGRSTALDEKNRRKLKVFEDQTPRQRILTYDDLRTQALTTFENLVGPMQLGGEGTEVYYPTPQEWLSFLPSSGEQNA